MSSTTTELSVIEVLDVCWHQCGRKRTEIQLLSDGSVVSHVIEYTAEELEDYECPLNDLPY